MGRGEEEEGRKGAEKIPVLGQGPAPNLPTTLLLAASRHRIPACRQLYQLNLLLLRSQSQGVWGTRQELGREVRYPDSKGLNQNGTLGWWLWDIVHGCPNGTQGPIATLP